MKKLVFSTGSGISAESGIATFRDAGGLWANYNVMDVASAEGFARNPALIHEFYNARRREMFGVQPNDAHRMLVDLEKDFDVRVITQNVDNLHERAGASHVLHLHGELAYVRALDKPSLRWQLTPDNPDTSVDTVIEGHHVRPDIVFFQEDVPNFEKAVDLAAEADIFVIIGTSLVVYPAAALFRFVRRGIPVFYIDPNPSTVPAGVTLIRKKAVEGMRELAEILRRDYL